MDVEVDRVTLVSDHSEPINSPLGPGDIIPDEDVAGNEA